MTAYPNTPGFRHNAPETSELAARAIVSRAATLRETALRLFTNGARFSVHELALVMKETVPSVQPRVSELRATGLLVDSGVRTTNPASGKKAVVWQAA